MNGNDVLGMLHAFKRTRYFYGMKLTEGTFNRDQSYFNQKRWQMNRLGLGVGVLCGLELSMAEDGQILVSPGVAVDAYGREIVLPQPYCFENPRQPTDALGRPVGEPVEQGSVTLCIAYHECETDYVPVFVADCDTREDCAASSIREVARFMVVEGTPDGEPVTISEEQCATIMDVEPGAEPSQRQTAVDTLQAACAEPDSDCVVLGTVIYGAEEIVLDTWTYRQQLFSNATLFDLVMCLAEDVARLKQKVCLTYVAGDAQSAPAGTRLENPLVVRVTDEDGNALSGQQVTFRARSEGTRIVGQTTRTTNNQGRAQVSVDLSETPGLNTVEVVVANECCCTVLFHAFGTQVDVDLPVVTAVFPATTTVVAQDDQARAIWEEQPRVELQFNHEMSVEALQDPERVGEWLRVIEVRNFGQNETFARRLALRFVDPVVLEGPAAGFVLANVEPGVEPGNSRQVAYVILARAQGGTPKDVNGLVLDADYLGLRLPGNMRNALWDAGDQTHIDDAFWGTLRDTGQALPSGDGSEGGQFSSWFRLVSVIVD